MDEIGLLEFGEGEMTVDALPSGDVYLTVQGVGGNADFVMTRPEAVELMQALLQAMKYPPQEVSSSDN